MTRLQKIRRRKAIEQQERCFYCGHLTWSSFPDQFAARHGMSRRAANHFRQTAEHLKACCEGGRAVPSNIVMACLYCNSRRHRRQSPMEPMAFKAKIKELLGQGRWHGRQVCLAHIRNRERTIR